MSGVGKLKRQATTMKREEFGDVVKKRCVSQEFKWTQLDED